MRTEHTHLSLRTHTCKNPHRRKLVLAGCVLIELSDTCLHGSQPTNTYHTLSTHTSEAKKFEKKLCDVERGSTNLEGEMKWRDSGNERLKK